MVDHNKTRRERELNDALEAIHFGFRTLISRQDEKLESLGYSRIHHRILYFIGRNPNCSINELLDIMRVTKQYLHRPLQRLIQDKYVQAGIDPTDRRVKRVTLTKPGTALEDELSGHQRRRFEKVFKKAGPGAEAGWRKVMMMLADSDE
ncbi:MAG: helix-turn-helix domain-containing protein [Gammaproteobacteria bacterium]|jgi:DNA-binding MarR family transcriptional regulator